MNTYGLSIEMYWTIRLIMGVYVGFMVGAYGEYLIKDMVNIVKMLSKKSES